MNTAYRDKIAIIGMGCRLPGANTLSGFWHILEEARSTVSRLDSCALLAANVTKEQLSAPHYVPYRGLVNVENLPQIDGYGLEARLLLETVYQALEHAGISEKDCPKHTAVYTGMLENTRDFYRFDATSPMTTIAGIKHLTYVKSLSSLISYQLDLQGNSMNLYTGCSTSLVAVVQAIHELLLHHTDLAIVGSVAVEELQTFGYFYEAEGILSVDGYCRTFDKAASGSVLSNGAGTVILKRLEDAIHDNNPIYAIIAGYATNNDGRLKPGFLAPGISGQYECIKTAWQRSGIPPCEVNYIEAHGSATQLGDSVEFFALNKAFQSQGLLPHQCGIGSVKTNIGHTTVVSGLAALLKTALMLHHRTIVPTLHFEEINPLIPIENSPFYIATEYQQHILKKQERMVAGISNFGFGGTNAHLVLHSHEH